MEYKPNQQWDNKHKNFGFVAERLYEAWNRLPNGQKPPTKKGRWDAGIANLKDLIKEAETGGKKLRACGSGWSLSEVAKNTEYFVETKPMNVVFDDLQPGFFETGNASMFVLSQGGTDIMEINTILKNKGLALSTSGASDGQTIAGAISTGTHGSAYKFGAMQDFVYGLQIITGNENGFWIEPTQRYVSQQFIDTMMPGVTRINDDEIFNAALVSFGSFGLIHSVLFKCEPLYKLETFIKYFKIEEVMPCINGPENFATLGFKPDPHHFEVIINPYRPNQVIARAMYKITGDMTDILAPGGDVSYGIGADVICLIGKIAGSIPATIPAMMKFLQKSLLDSYPETNGTKNFPGVVFSGGQTSFNGPAISTEIGIDARQTTKVLGILREEAEKVKLPGIIALRYVKKSKALLAFTKFDITCTIEIPTVLSKQTLKFYNDVWQRLENENIVFTFHLGQCNNLDAERLRQKWGQTTVETWMKARKQILPGDHQRRMFSNDFTEKCGLNDFENLP